MHTRSTLTSHHTVGNHVTHENVNFIILTLLQCLFKRQCVKKQLFIIVFFTCSSLSCFFFNLLVSCLLQCITSSASWPSNLGDSLPYTTVMMRERCDIYIDISIKFIYEFSICILTWISTIGFFLIRNREDGFLFYFANCKSNGKIM